MTRDFFISVINFICVSPNHLLDTDYYRFSKTHSSIFSIIYTSDTQTHI